MNQTTKPSLDRTGTVPHLRKPMVVFAPASRTASHRRTARARLLGAVPLSCWSMSRSQCQLRPAIRSYETRSTVTGCPTFTRSNGHTPTGRWCWYSARRACKMASIRARSNFPNEPGSPLVVQLRAIGGISAAAVAHASASWKMKASGPARWWLRFSRRRLASPARKTRSYNPADTFENELARFTHSDLAREWNRISAIPPRSAAGGLRSKVNTAANPANGDPQPSRRNGSRGACVSITTGRCWMNAVSTATPRLAADEKRPHRLEKVAIGMCKELGVIHVSELSDDVFTAMLPRTAARRRSRLHFVTMPESLDVSGLVLAEVTASTRGICSRAEKKKWGARCSLRRRLTPKMTSPTGTTCWPPGRTLQRRVGREAVEAVASNRGAGRWPAATTPASGLPHYPQLTSPTTRRFHPFSKSVGHVPATDFSPPRPLRVAPQANPGASPSRRRAFPPAPSPSCTRGKTALRVPPATAVSTLVWKMNTGGVSFVTCFSLE